MSLCKVRPHQQQAGRQPGWPAGWSLGARCGCVPGPSYGHHSRHSSPRCVSAGRPSPLTTTVTPPSSPAACPHGRPAGRPARRGDSMPVRPSVVRCPSVYGMRGIDFVPTNDVCQRLLVAGGWPPPYGHLQTPAEKQPSFSRKPSSVQHSLCMR